MAVRTVASREHDRLLEKQNGNIRNVAGEPVGGIPEEELEIQPLPLQMELKSWKLELWSKELELERLKRGA